MEDLVACVTGQVFDVELALEEQIGSLPLPFAGMDKSGAAVCLLHLKGRCERGTSCPYRHIKGDRTVVCKHWLRGLCKKGDMCEFLHEYDMTKMPECYFYSKYNSCTNKECPFLHIDPESKIRDCPWYDRGFCRHGPNCRHRHTRRVMCVNYLCGFCPDGAHCKFVHPRFDLPSLADNSLLKKGLNHVVCHYCNEVGHKIYQCHKMPPDQREEMMQNRPPFQPQHHHANHHHQNHHPPQNNHPGHPISSHPGGGAAAGDMGGSGPRMHRPLDQVTCFKCGDKGHYANKCPKGMFAFLSPNLPNVQSQRMSQ